MRVLLVRHGQSEWNATRRLQGQADIALSEKGRAQAASIGPVVRSIAPDRIISSDLRRASETASIINAGEFSETEMLRENNVGDWTGREIDDIVAEDRMAWLGWRAGTMSPPGGESWEAFADRVTGAITAEMLNPCNNLLVICHGGVIRAVLQRLLNLQPANIIPVGPGSLSAIRLSDDSEKPPRLELFNYRPDQLEFEAPD